jgi:serine/threonine protein kinase
MAPLAETLPGQYPDFCDLLQRLLEYEPDKRMTARDALQHRFFDRVRYANHPSLSHTTLYHHHHQVQSELMTSCAVVCAADLNRGKYGDMGERPDPFVLESIVASDSEIERSDDEDDERDEDGERRSRRSGSNTKKSKDNKKEKATARSSKSSKRSGEKDKTSKRGGSRRDDRGGEKDKRRKGKERERS